MFNGIIRYLGRIAHIFSPNEISIFSEIKNIKKGDSIACSGVCLTVTHYAQDIFSVYLSDETLSCTNFKFAKIRDYINLEEPLKFGEGIDGHLVSGHVDAEVEVLSITKKKDSCIFRFFLPEKYRKFITNKGCIAINGISLTVNETATDFFEVNIIPYTFNSTNLQYIQIGSMVNLEVDLLARYMDKIVASHYRD